MNPDVYKKSEKRKLHESNKNWYQNKKIFKIPVNDETSSKDQSSRTFIPSPCSSPVSENSSSDDSLFDFNNDEKTEIEFDPVINRYQLNLASLFNEDSTNDKIKSLILKCFIICIQPKIDDNHDFTRPINYNLNITVEETLYSYCKMILVIENIRYNALYHTESNAVYFGQDLKLENDKIISSDSNQFNEITNISSNEDVIVLTLNEDDYQMQDVDYIEIHYEDDIDSQNEDYIQNQDENNVQNQDVNNVQNQDEDYIHNDDEDYIIESQDEDAIEIHYEGDIESQDVDAIEIHYEGDIESQDEDAIEIHYEGDIESQDEDYIQNQDEDYTQNEYEDDYQNHNEDYSQGEISDHNDSNVKVVYLLDDLNNGCYYEVYEAGENNENSADNNDLNDLGSIGSTREHLIMNTSNNLILVMNDTTGNEESYDDNGDPENYEYQDICPITYHVSSSDDHTNNVSMQEKNDLVNNNPIIVSEVHESFKEGDRVSEENGIDVENTNVSNNSTEMNEKCSTSDIYNKTLEDKEKEIVAIINEVKNDKNNSISIYYNEGEEKDFVSKLSWTGIGYINITNGINNLFPDYSEEIYKKGIISKLYNQYCLEIENKHLETPLKLTIEFSDLLTVARTTGWLTEAVVNNYLKLIENRCSEQIGVFTSFFYTTYIEKGYQGVASWYRKLDIFCKEKLIIPIIHENHWTLLCVEMKNKKLYYYNSYHNKKDLSFFKEYVKLKYESKFNQVCDWEWEEETEQISPKQNNHYDCGVFTCVNADFFALEIPSNFAEEDTPILRQKIIYELLTQKLCFQKIDTAYST